MGGEITAGTWRAARGGTPLPLSRLIQVGPYMKSIQL
jgi:hypothetical protein